MGVWVALRKESVDRNFAVHSTRKGGCTSLSARRAWIEISQPLYFTTLPVVALRKESVDRNSADFVEIDDFKVALRKESVDRNPVRNVTTDWASASLSARRAWIEIFTNKKQAHPKMSLSARRAWIEIGYGMFLFLTVQGGFVHADIRFNFKNCYSKKLSDNII